MVVDDAPGRVESAQEGLVNPARFLAFGFCEVQDFRAVVEGAEEVPALEDGDVVGEVAAR